MNQPAVERAEVPALPAKRGRERIVLQRLLAIS